MTQTLVRGRLLSFLRRPEAIDDTASYRYEEDGGLLVEDGMIVDAGPYAAVRAMAAADAEEIDHRPHLILPGLIDTHAHFPQMR
jgi:guanine deaminase